MEKKTDNRENKTSSVERWEEGMIETEDQSRESINNKRDSAMKKAI